MKKWYKLENKFVDKENTCGRHSSFHFCACATRLMFYPVALCFLLTHYGVSTTNMLSKAFLWVEGFMYFVILLSTIVFAVIAYRRHYFKKWWMPIMFFGVPNLIVVASYVLSLFTVHISPEPDLSIHANATPFIFIILPLLIAWGIFCNYAYCSYSGRLVVEKKKEYIESDNNN